LGGNLREVICDVECLSDFLGGLALNHICDGLATGIKKGLDIQIVGRLKSKTLGSMKNDTRGRKGQRRTDEDDFKQHFLIDLHEFRIPVINVGGLFVA